MCYSDEYTAEYTADSPLGDNEIISVTMESSINPVTRLCQRKLCVWSSKGSLLMVVAEPDINVISEDGTEGSAITITYRDRARRMTGPPMLCGMFSDGREVQIMSESQYKKSHSQQPDFSDDFVQAMLI